MDNREQYHSSYGLRPPLEFTSRTHPPPSNTQHQRLGNVPFSSSQFQGPPPPVHNTFQNNRFTEPANYQSSNAVHSHGYPPPDFTLPPPSFRNYGNDTSASNSEMQHQGNTTTTQGYGPHYSLPPRQNYGFSAVPSTSLGSCGQTTLEAREGFLRHEFADSSLTSAVISNSSQDESKSVENNEQMWLKNFEQQIKGRGRGGPRRESVTAKKKPLKLIEVQQMVSQSQVLNDKLFQLREKMSLLQKDTQDQVWCGFLEQAEKIKRELDVIMVKFRDELFIEDVYRLVHQRRRKRERKKRQHKIKVIQNKELEKSWKKEEEKIDAWKEKLRLKEEEERRELAIKTEADSILGEVRQKQADGLKMQQLLESLTTLRIVRLNKGAAHGFISTPQHDQLFATTLKNITDVVNTQMEEYKKEEQTLRVMMEESTSYQRTNAGKEPSEAINKLETLVKKLLFGNTTPIDQETYNDFTAADHCLQTLLQRRMDWDQFICQEDLPIASSVPSGWVIPPSQPKIPWHQYQG